MSNMEIFGTGMRYAFDRDGGTLTVTFGGGAGDGVIDTWHRMKAAFAMQLSCILRCGKVDTVRFRGSRFGREVFRLCRYDLREMLDGRTNQDYITEESTMKLLYLEHAIFCTSRCGEACDDGLTIGIDAPLDTEFRFEREDGAVYHTAAKDGIVKIPAHFLTDGRCLMCAVRSGLPSNVLEMEVKAGRCGRVITCRTDECDLLDAVHKLMRTLYDTQKKVSAHIDGYDVI